MKIRSFILTITFLIFQNVQAGPAVSGGVGPMGKIQCRGTFKDGTEIIFNGLVSAIPTARIGLLQNLKTGEVIAKHICKRITGIDSMSKKERRWVCKDFEKISGLSVIINEDNTATVRRVYPLPMKDFANLSCGR